MQQHVAPAAGSPVFEHRLAKTRVTLQIITMEKTVAGAENFLTVLPRSANLILNE